MTTMTWHAIDRSYQRNAPLSPDEINLRLRTLAKSIDIRDSAIILESRHDMAFVIIVRQTPVTSFWRESRRCDCVHLRVARVITYQEVIS